MGLLAKEKTWEKTFPELGKVTIRYRLATPVDVDELYADGVPSRRKLFDTLVEEIKCKEHPEIEDKDVFLITPACASAYVLSTAEMKEGIFILPEEKN